MAQKSISITYTANVSKAITSLTKLESKLKKIDKLAKSSSFNINVKGANGSKGTSPAKEQMAEAKAQVQLAKAQEAQAKAEAAKLKVQEQQVKQSQAVVKLQAAQAKFEHEQEKYKAESVKAQGTPVAEARPTVRTGLFADDYGDRNQRAQDYIDSLSQRPSRATAALKSLASTVGGVLKGALTAAGAAARGLGSALGTLAKSSLGKLTSSIKNSTKGITNLWNSLKRIAMYRALRSAIKTITDGFNQGVENAYRWAQVNNNQLAASLDSLSTSSLYLKNSIGAMAAPLINMLAPAIATVVDWVVTLINALNRLFAMLGGQGTWIKATKQATNYKDAVGGASKALKSFTIGIDELNILEDNGGGGGGGASADAGGMFEEVALGASALRDAITNGEWMKVGELIAESINDSIAKIDAKLLGKKIGDKIENAIELAYGFLKTINTEQIGSKLAEFLNSGLQAIDTNLLGKTIAEKWNRVVDFVYGFASTANWEQFGQKIADYFVGVVTNFDSAKFAMAGSSLINGLLTSAITAVDNAPWSAFGTKIATFLNTFDWKGTLSKVLTLGTKFMNGLLETIISTLSGTDWKKFGQGIRDAIDEYLSSGEFINLLKNLFTLSVELTIAVESIVWNNIPEEELNAWTVPLFAVFPALGSVVDNIYELNNAFGENETEINELNIWWNGFKDNIDTVWNQKVIPWIETGCSKVKTFVAGMKKDTNDSTDEMNSKTKLNFKEIKSTIETKWGEIKTNTSTNWATIKSDVMTKWYDMQNDAISKYGNIKSTIETAWNNIKTNSDTVWGSVKSKVLEIWDNIKSGISERTTAVLGDVEEFVNKLIDKINEAIESVNNLLSIDVGEHSFGVNIPTIQHVEIDGRASGGFMDIGQVYTVREGGIPEYVGRYGNRAAVANNDQIVEGIAGGVSVANEEVVAAINTLIGVVVEKDLSVNIGDKEIGQANERYTQGRGVYVNRGSFAGAY